MTSVSESKLVLALIRVARVAVYHGARARFHYFECLQLLLRKQIGVLIEAWKLPTEFEVRLLMRRTDMCHYNMYLPDRVQRLVGTPLESSPHPAASRALLPCPRSRERARVGAPGIIHEGCRRRRER